jgi:hypothetical protein
MTDEGIARIQIRKDGKCLGFLTPKGGINRLRVHAALVPLSGIQDQIVRLTADNPGYEFTVQRIGK